MHKFLVWTHVFISQELEIGEEREFPGGPVVRIWCFHCHDPSSTPGWGTEILQATCCGQNFLKKKLRRRICLGVMMAFWQLWSFLVASWVARGGCAEGQWEGRGARWRGT